MRETFLPFSPPAVGDEEINEVVDALRSGWITTGPRTKRFEREFAAYTGAEAALAVNSATAALHCGLAALGVGPGDAVITTSLTFCSSVHVIEQVGARPVLVDVEPDTLNIDPAKVAEAAENLRPGERLAAILPVHLYGHPCDRESLIQIAKQHGAPLLEDAAHAFPTSYKDRLLGAAEDHGVPVLTAFSFYATKNLTMGEGGVLTGPEALVEEARLWSLHGMSRDAWKRYQGKKASWFYEVIRPGFKYNMTDIQAAMGLAQLRKMEWVQSRREKIARRYNEAFAGLPELEIPAERPGVGHAWHVYALRLQLERLTIDRAEFIEALVARNISASVHFIPIHIHPYYRDRYKYSPEAFSVAYAQYQRLVSLPIYPLMSEADVEDVIEAVTGIVEDARATARTFAAATWR